jgi:hypothetical protein
VPELEYIDLHAGRKCSEWFTAAGLTDLHMDVKPYKWHHSTVNEQEPSRLDLVPFPGDTSNMWWETLQDMLAAGLLDDATVDRARQETKAWYNNPNRFYYWALLFVAGKV